MSTTDGKKLLPWFWRLMLDVFTRLLRSLQGVYFLGVPSADQIRSDCWSCKAILYYFINIHCSLLIWTLTIIISLWSNFRKTHLFQITYIHRQQYIGQRMNSESLRRSGPYKKWTGTILTCEKSLKESSGRMLSALSITSILKDKTWILWSTKR